MKQLQATQLIVDRYSDFCHTPVKSAEYYEAIKAACPYNMQFVNSSYINDGTDSIMNNELLIFIGFPNCPKGKADYVDTFDEFMIRIGSLTYSEDSFEANFPTVKKLITFLKSIKLVKLESNETAVIFNVDTSKEKAAVCIASKSQPYEECNIYQDQTGEAYILRPDAKVNPIIIYLKSLKPLSKLIVPNLK